MPEKITQPTTGITISIVRDGAEIGDWPEDQVRDHFQKGQLVSTDLYWHEGMTQWEPLRNLMKPPLPSPGSVGFRQEAYEPPPLPGIEVTVAALPAEPKISIGQVPPPLSPPEFSNVVPPGWRVATFRRRAMARMIDYFFLTILTGTVLAVLLIPVFLWNPPPLAAGAAAVILGYIVSNALFFCWDWIWGGLGGSSIGKWIYGLRVVSANEPSLSWHLSAQRSHALLQSLWYLLAYPFVTFWIAGAAEKRFLKTATTAWDKKAGTAVVAKDIGVARLTFATILTLICFIGLLIWSALSTSSLKALMAP